MSEQPWRMPEWLPSPGEPIDAETARLVATYYRDQLGELCAGIQHQLQRTITGEAFVKLYEPSTLLECWAANPDSVVLAYVMVVGVATKYAGRSVLLRCDLTTGGLAIQDLDGLLD